MYIAAGWASGTRCLCSPVSPFVQWPISYQGRQDRRQNHTGWIYRWRVPIQFSQRSKALSLSEWEELLRAVEQADLWNIPEFIDDFGLDGATWTIEGRKNDCRRRISRWCPNELLITDLGAVFFKLAGDGQAIALGIE